MSWAVGYDSSWHRDIGYGVPATCDRPGCGESIDRGLFYVCGGEPYGGDKGCGLYFCSDHLLMALSGPHEDDPQMCERCCDDEEPYEPTPDVDQWIAHKLTDSSWRRWRDENPAEVDAMRAAVAP